MKGGRAREQIQANDERSKNHLIGNEYDTWLQKEVEGRYSVLHLQSFSAKRNYKRTVKMSGSLSFIHLHVHKPDKDRSIHLHQV